LKEYALYKLTVPFTRLSIMRKKRRRNTQLTVLQRATHCIFVQEQVTANLEEILAMLLQTSHKLFLYTVKIAPIQYTQVEETAKVGNNALPVHVRHT